MSPFQPPLERLQYVDGQVLATHDLRAAQDTAERLRALHNRYLHQTWGIASGLTVAPSANHRGAVVQAGSAIDADGNLILVEAATTVEAPALAQPQTLALALSAPGELAWWLPRDVVSGAHVLLGAALMTDGVISGNMDASMRRYLQSFAAPRLATGATVTGQTDWVDSTGPATWVETSVDTAAAGFVSAPQYFVTVPSAWDVQIVSAGPQSFVVRLIGASAKEANTDAWTVSWIGIESAGLL